jgi:hypothetical protein
MSHKPPSTILESLLNFALLTMTNDVGAGLTLESQWFSWWRWVGQTVLEEQQQEVSTLGG